MGLEGATYRLFRQFLCDQGCEAEFDIAFYNHNHATGLDASLWKAGQEEFFVCQAFDWKATPEGRDFWREIDQRWWNELLRHGRLIV